MHAQKGMAPNQLRRPSFQKDDEGDVEASCYFLITGFAEGVYKSWVGLGGFSLGLVLV